MNRIRSPEGAICPRLQLHSIHGEPVHHVVPIVTVSLSIYRGGVFAPLEPWMHHVVIQVIIRPRKTKQVFWNMKTNAKRKTKHIIIWFISNKWKSNHEKNKINWFFKTIYLTYCIKIYGHVRFPTSLFSIRSYRFFIHILVLKISRPEHKLLENTLTER